MPKYLARILAFCAGLILVGVTEASTSVWTGASGTDTNWSDGNNWAGSVPPAASDDVKFFDAGANATASNVNNAVDGAFSGTIGSLQYGNTNGFHTTLISTGQTLNITGSDGLSVFMPIQDTADGPAKSVLATIIGAGATLNLDNTNANLVINQSHTNSPGGRAMLDLSGLDTFTANISRLGIGTVSLPNTRNPGGGISDNRCLGTLYLAKTNLIRLNYAVPLATYLAANAINALEISRNPKNNSGAISYLYLGQTNAFYVDSLGVGRDKASVSAAGWMGFDPVLTNSNPTAYFRGTGGDSSRVTWWGIGDMNASASSVQSSVGICDFSNGKVDALVNVMSLARDGSPTTTATANNEGVLTFTAGTMNINTLYVGNQSLGGVASGGNYNGCVGVVNVNGSNATLVVNNNLVLGRTLTNSVTAQRTSGTLNVNHGVVRANTISVGPFGTNNTINLFGGTLFVTNTFGTNTVGTVDQPITTLTLSNATLWLSVETNDVPRVAVSALQTGGTSNSIGLASVPVFPSYPTQVVLIKYTTLDSYHFGLANSLDAAPGAYLVNNTTNHSIDLVLTSGPTPAVGGLSFLQQPENAVAGDFIAPAVKVVVTNSDGSLATNVPVFISLFSGTGPLQGTLNQTTDGNGVASFTNLSLTASGTKTLRAAAGGKTAVSASFNILPAPPVSLAFVQQPIDTVAGQVIAPAVTLQLLDAYGNNSPTSGIGVNLSLSSGSGTITGASTVYTDPNGQATFTNLSIDLTGTKQLIASADSLSGATSRSLVILPNIPLPIIPNQTFYVASYGAMGDGVSTNTVAIQNTINAAALAGGGTVEITPGVYLSGPLNLSNNINLQIDSGAVLQMLPYGSYPTNVPNFITCSQLHDVAISGEGTIDGQGAPWWALFRADNSTPRPHDMILMYNCTNVLVENVTLRNPPNFHLDLNHQCVNVNVRHVTVNTHTPSPNTDGLDISADHCLVQYCSFNDGDDDPVLKGPAYNVTIADCNVGLTSGIAVGSTLANGGATNFDVVNCLLTNTVSAISLKSDRDRGNLLQDFTFANLSLSNVQRALVIYSYYTNSYFGSLNNVTPAIAALDSPQPVTATTPIWRDITFSNLTATATGPAGIIWGLPEMLVSNVTFTKASISAGKSFDIFNARGVRFVDSSVTTPFGVNNFELYNTELTISNSAPVSAAVTLDGFSTNGIGNTLSLYNAPALVINTNLFSANPAITLGGSTLTISNNLNLGANSSLNFVLGTNATCLAVAGNLVLNGTINVIAGAGFASTNYTLFTYTGGLSGQPVLGSVPGGYHGVLDTNTPGQVILVVTYTGLFPTPTTTTIRSSANPSHYGITTTFTATVDPAPTNGEAVIFKDDGTVLGTAILTNGKAAFETTASQLAIGYHSITALYAGDGAYNASTSATLSQLVYPSAGTYFADTFSNSTVNASTPMLPTPISTSYEVLSGKPWNPTPSTASGNLVFGIGSTSSGVVEVQARFASPGVTLVSAGNFVQLSVTFTNTAGILSQSGFWGFGLYNSSGSFPIGGGLDATMSTSYTNAATGGAQNWRGYFAQIAYTGGNSGFYDREIQTGTANNNQDLVTTGTSSSPHNPDPLEIGPASTAPSVSLTVGSEYTEVLTYTLTFSNTLQLASQLYTGAGTNGTLLSTMTANTGTPPLTAVFDGLAFGWRATGSTPSTMTVSSISVTGQGTQVAPTIGYTFSGSTLALNWPTNYLGWLLQSNSSDLASGDWSTIPGSSNTADFSIPIDPAGIGVFYRLAAP